MTKKYDVIIIGAGLGGLTTASILSKAGKHVLVIEKNSSPGGYAVSFKRNGFEFDAGLHFMYGCKKTGNTYSILKKCGIAKKIKFFKPKFLYRSIFPDLDFKVPQGKIESYKGLIKKIFPGEEKGIETLFIELKKIYTGIYNFDKHRVFSREFTSSLNIQCKELLDKHLKSKKIKAVIFQLWPYFGLSPSKLPIFYFAYPWFEFLKGGGYYPSGGAQSISNALCKVIINNGSQILFNHKVKNIVIKDNFVKGVLSETNEEFVSDIVVSNIDARNTFIDLIGYKNLPRKFIKDLRNLEPSISAFQVYLGLSVDMNKLGLHDYEIFVNPSYDLESQFKDSLYNKFKKTPFALTIYSNIDKTITKNNKSIVVITVFSGYDFWKRMTKEEYKTKKESFSILMIHRAEKIIPNLSKLIETKETATPLTMERYTGSYKGAIYGWAPLISQTGLKRMDFKTPVKRLYLVGAWTRPGGGTTGVMYSGMALAEQLLKSSNLQFN